jgi:hypothetical protein
LNDDPLDEDVVREYSLIMYDQVSLRDVCDWFRVLCVL